jgi:hypothetical protein
MSDLRERIAKAVNGIGGYFFDQDSFDLNVADAVLEALGWKPGQIIVCLDRTAAHHFLDVDTETRKECSLCASFTATIQAAVSTSPLEKPE